MIPYRPAAKIRRLWWRCTLCSWKVDTFGVDHDHRGDRCSLGWEVLDHLEIGHGRRLDSLLDAADLFQAAGAVIPRKPRVLVSRHS